MAVDCSELAQNLTDIAMNLGSRPDVKNLADVVRKMEKLLPGVTRQVVIDAIVESTEGRKQKVDDLAKKLNAIKAEARTDKKLQRKISKLEELLRVGRRADTPKQRKIGSDTVERLRKTSSNLTRWLKNNNPTAEKRLKQKLQDLQSKIAIGDIDPQRSPKTEFREPVRQLQEQINQARKTITDARAIDKVENQIDALNKHLDEGTLPKIAKKDKFISEPVRIAREIRDDLKKKIAKSEPAQKQRLEKQIADLTRRIETGDILPQRRIEIPKTKELERLEFDRDELQRKIRRQINDLKPKTIWEHIAEPFNTARGIITSMDFSAVLRQGGFVVFSHPVRSAKAIGPMLKAFASKRIQAQINEQILSRPNAPLYRKAKLFIAPIDGTYKLSDREEIMQAKLLDKIPGVAASNRAYTTFLNLVRADSFDTLVAGLSKTGEVTLDEAKVLANFVNVSTGRGSLGALEQAALPLNTVFFAPRYVASRFQLLLGQPFFKGNARTRKLMAKEYARFLIGLATVYAIGLWAGGDIEDDPRSADFGKIKFGNTRVDPLSGISQVTVLLSRLVSGKVKSSVSGNVTPIRGDKVPIWSGGTPEVVSRFLRSKLSPMFGKALDLAAGENVVGEKVTLSSIIADLTVPLAMREILETMQEQGIPRGPALSILAIFGMGIQTYGSQIRKRKGAETFTFGK